MPASRTSTGRRQNGLGDPAGRKRTWWVGLAFVAGLIVFAYGFGETEVNLDQIRSETRRVGLVRILRALARPELIEYDRQETVTDSPVLIPCQDGASLAPPQVGRYLTMDPPCADPRAQVTIEGFAFSPNQQIRLSFVPGSAVELRLADVRSDADGHFSAVVRLPNRPDENPQMIRAISSEPVGSPRFTTTARDTLEKIIETVFMALVATTFATFLAVPLSFFAARNLMENITSPLTNVAMGLIAAPFGVAAGVLAARGASLVADTLTDNSALALIGLALAPLIAWRFVRMALPAEETTRPTTGQRAFRALLLVVAGLLAVLALYLAADLLQVAGNWARPCLGVFGFVAQFFATVGELLEFGVIVVAALFGAGALRHAFQPPRPRPSPAPSVGSRAFDQRSPGYGRGSRGRRAGRQGRRLVLRVVRPGENDLDPDRDRCHRRPAPRVSIHSQ